MRWASGYGRADDRDLIGIAQAIKDRDLASKPDELRSLLGGIVRARQHERLRAIRSLRQNQPVGLAVLAAAAGLAVAAVLVAFCTMSPALFGALAKVTFLVFGLAGALIVAVEDPFHEDLGETATPLERLKLQGKVLVVTTMTAVLCTGLSFYTDHLERCRDQFDLALRIDLASIRTVSQLERTRIEGELLAARLQALNETVDHSLVSSLKQIGDATSKIAALPTRAELYGKEEIDRRLTGLATVDSVRRLATSDQLTRLATSVDGLAKADSIGRLSATVGTLATADSMRQLATADSVNRLSATVGTLATASSVGQLATADSVNRLAATVGTLATADSMRQLATADSVSHVAAIVNTLATADSVTGFSRAIAELVELVRQRPATAPATQSANKPPDRPAASKIP